MTLQFFEVVKILSSPSIPRLRGGLGVVLGVYHENGDDTRPIVAYGVKPEGEEESFKFFPYELEGTGKLRDRSEFFTGESIRVRVIDGEGFLVDDQDRALQSLRRQSPGEQC